MHGLHFLVSLHEYVRVCVRVCVRVYISECALIFYVRLNFDLVPLPVRWLHKHE